MKEFKEKQVTVACFEFEYPRGIWEVEYPLIKLLPDEVIVDYYGQEKSYSTKNFKGTKVKTIAADQQEIESFLKDRQARKQKFREWMLAVDAHLEKAGFQWEVWAIDFPFRDAYEKGEDPASIASISVNFPLYKHRKDERRGYSIKSW
jgi:hypothetical protein